MKTKLALLSAVALLFLSACTSSATPQATVTVTAQPDSGNSSSSSVNKTDEFIMYMGVAGVPDYMLTGEALDILIDQAKTTCGYIDDGDSKSDIIWIITLAAEQSNSSQEIVDAFLAASVAATFVYCPEYQGFWD